ncbi:MAG TPA: RNA-binding protein [candidate division Zixibacteria bacterium]|nr:RNA-binding protein [candidate division Zixibacteria bacterium]MDD4917429.1 RNA-binding protein [candidate division Zixibacteria bacterium]MDM7972987.1 RNA-binding protein [candidate division Zixibacteria bacterium]HOD67548.1 RNA-binding protein [candidate division Zixibacteria bacterium]HPM36641.1 RNA-binding protein [candidate division Zixibacteria bacterium]
MNIYVGNLPFSTDEEELKAKFEAYGTVTSAKIIMDRVSGRSRGFAFVEMPNDEEAQAAIDGLQGSDYGGRALTVSEARPREGGGGGGGRGGGRDRDRGDRERW